MNQPVLSIDVAKAKSVAAAFLSYGECVQKPFSFSHSPRELTTLLDLLHKLEERSNQRPYVVLEATGNFSKPLASFFSAHGFQVVVLNPLYTHQIKKKSVRKIKTDPIDAIRIAQAFYLGERIPQVKEDRLILELRALCRQYDHWSSLFSEVQLQFLSVLDLLFPGYDKVFHKLYNDASLELLSCYPTPQEILAADREDLIGILMQNRRGRTWNEVRLPTSCCA